LRLRGPATVHARAGDAEGDADPAGEHDEEDVRAFHAARRGVVYMPCALFVVQTAGQRHVAIVASGPHVQMLSHFHGAHVHVVIVAPAGQTHVSAQLKYSLSSLSARPSQFLIYVQIYVYINHIFQRAEDALFNGSETEAI
jgi:hypothetical protein